MGDFQLNFFELGIFAYSSFEELEYSVPFSTTVTLEEPLDETLLLDLEAPWMVFDTGGAFAWDAGLFPSSANFLSMFMTVGRNLVDNDSIPGSCREKSGFKVIKSTGSTVPCILVNKLCQ